MTNLKISRIAQGKIIGILDIMTGTPMRIKEMMNTNKKQIEPVHKLRFQIWTTTLFSQINGSYTWAVIIERKNL